MALVKTEAGGTVAGTSVHYDFKITNNGPSYARNVSLHDVLPAQMDFQSAFVGVAGPPNTPLACNLVAAGTNEYLCPLGDIAPNSPIEVIINVLIHANVPVGTNVSNTADVRTDTPDPNTANNSSTTAFIVTTSADLVTVKTSDADTYKSSATIKYTITVTNNGPSDAQAVVVTDTLPNNTFWGANATTKAIYQFDSGACTNNGVPKPNGDWRTPPTTLTCSFGTIGAGQSKSINVYVQTAGNIHVKTQVFNMASVA
ncbi:MAG: hypothetical protein ACRD1G_12350, partial [Acidimicrobiales bacterium]